MSEMAMKMVMSLLKSGNDMLSDSSRVFLIKEDGRCWSKPGPDQMIKYADAIKTACGDVSII